MFGVLVEYMDAVNCCIEEEKICFVCQFLDSLSWVLFSDAVLYIAGSKWLKLCLHVQCHALA